MSRRAENLRRKRQRKIMLIRKYIRFTFCCVLIVVLAFAINYLKKNMNNISESGNSGVNNVKKICRKTWLHFRGLSGKYKKII